MSRKKIIIEMSSAERIAIYGLIPDGGFNDNCAAIIAQPWFEFDDGNETGKPQWRVTALSRAETYAVAAALDANYTELSRMLRDYGFDGDFEQRVRAALTELKHLREMQANGAAMQMELIP